MQSRKRICGTLQLPQLQQQHEGFPIVFQAFAIRLKASRFSSSSSRPSSCAALVHPAAMLSSAQLLCSSTIKLLHGGGDSGTHRSATAARHSRYCCFTSPGCTRWRRRRPTSWRPSGPPRRWTPPRGVRCSRQPQAERRSSRATAPRRPSASTCIASGAQNDLQHSSCAIAASASNQLRAAAAAAHRAICTYRIMLIMSGLQDTRSDEELSKACLKVGRVPASAEPPCGFSHHFY